MIGLSILFVGIHLFEALLYDSCQADQLKQATTREQIIRAKEMHYVDMQLLKRLVAESQADPEIARLLKRHNINVVATPLPPRATNPSSAPVTPDVNPTIPGKPAPL